MQPKLQHLVIQVCCICGLSHQVRRMYEFVLPQSNLIVSVLPIFHLDVPDVPFSQENGDLHPCSPRNIWHKE